MTLFKMKKLLILVLVPYLLLIGIVFYIYFGPGVLTGYGALQWKDIETMAPVGSKVKIYQGNGWEVYSLKKATVFIKVAVKPAMDVAGLPASSKKVLYKASAGPGEIYYISNPRKTIEVVYAQTVGDATLYIGVAGPSLLSGRYIMAKMTRGCFYKGQAVMRNTATYSAPLRCYLNDIIFLAAMILPLIIVLVIFLFSGRRPSSRYFEGDPIRLEESYVVYSSIRRFRRQNNFCYLVLTSGRLMMFVFMRPVWAVDIHRQKPDIKIEGNKIILQKENEKIIFRPSGIKEWKEALSFLLS